MHGSLVRCLLSCLLLLAAAGCRSSRVASDDALRTRAQRLAQEYVIVDGHIDVPYRFAEGGPEDLATRTAGGDFDYVRARAGGLDAPFMSIYIPARYQETGGAKALADSLIDLVEGFERQWPDKFAVARSVDDVRRAVREGRIALPMGMENGAPIETLDDLRHFHGRGVRYVTLAHGKDNRLSDSSYDSTRTWQGLSPFGEAVVREMNTLGVIVDVSHLSDDAARDVLRLTKAPVMATHSSLRHFTPGWERNMSDELVRALAGNGGVIMICFGSSFLRSAYDPVADSAAAAVNAHLRAQGIDPDSPAAAPYREAQRKAHPIGTVADVADHIDRAVQLAGIDHVGLGSDFDGVFALPAGLQDVSMYPNLVYELLKRGYSDADLRKLLGENALRVWSEVERIARER